MMIVLVVVFVYNLPFDWNVEVGDVAETEVDQAFQVVLAQVVLEALSGELLAVLHGEQAVF